MPIHKIRELIKEAVEIECQSGKLNQAIVKLYEENDWNIDHEQINCLLRFVQQYVEDAPALLEDLIRIANRAGIYKEVQHIIDVAVEYFLSPLDVIPDDLGLLGLIDDAYLTHRLIQFLANVFQSKVDKPLISPKLNRANLFIRCLIGEPQATMLDNAVTYSFRTPNIQQSLVNLLKFPSHIDYEEIARIWDDTPFRELKSNRHN